LGQHVLEASEAVGPTRRLVSHPLQLHSRRVQKPPPVEFEILIDVDGKLRIPPTDRLAHPGILLAPKGFLRISR